MFIVENNTSLIFFILQQQDILFKILCSYYLSILNQISLIYWSIYTYLVFNSKSRILFCLLKCISCSRNLCYARKTLWTCINWTQTSFCLRTRNCESHTLLSQSMIMHYLYGNCEKWWKKIFNEQVLCKVINI